MNISENLVKDRELELGDVVEVHDGAYGHATVKNIDNVKQIITFFKPYVHTANFSYTGGVICYIGIEEFRSDIIGKEWRLIEKGKQLK